MTRASVTALILLLGIGCYPKGWRETTPLYLVGNTSPFHVGPYVLKTGPQRATVVLEHQLEEAPTLIWWFQDTNTVLSVPQDQNRTSFQFDDALWVAEIDNIDPSTGIGYFVMSEVGTSEPARFRVGRPMNERFKFAAIGDTRTGHRVHRALMESLALREIDFVINSGDLVESGGYKEEWDLFFQIEHPVVSKAPLFAAVGNHDNSPRQLFRRWFRLEDWANGHRYFVQDWGSVRVVCLDSEIEMRAGSEQYAFLERALAEGAKKDQLMVVSLHYPPYSSGAHGPNPHLQRVLGVLGERYGVEVVLSGHDHNYERTIPIKGVTYIVAASGGAPIRRLTPSWWSEMVRTEPHYIVFDVDRGNLIGEAINLNGSVFDRFIIKPVPPQAAP
ncbi:MAG: metallophosphoesterase family protein [Myxococcota bacterium]